MKFFKFAALIVAAALLLTACPPAIEPVAKSDLKLLNSFSFKAADNSGVILVDTPVTYNDATQKWEATLPAFTTVTALKASFEISEKATATVGGVTQVSGSTVNDFTSDVKYTVTAEDGSSTDYTISIKVTVPATDSVMASFVLGINGTPTAATISGTNISLVLAPGTDPAILTNLIATFNVHSKAVVKIGSDVQTSGVTANDFSTAKTYVVTAEDGTFSTYNVSVTIQTPSKLIISEYYEGSSNNKYIEITNTDTVDVDLSTYALRAYTNGSTTPATTNYALSGTLPAGKSVVYVNDGYTVATLDTINTMSTTVGNATGWKVLVAYAAGGVSISPTGNDVLELVQGSVGLTAITVDSFGIKGATVDSTNGGKDIKMIRKPGKTGVWTYNIADWYAVPITTSATADDDTAGSFNSTGSGSTLTEFWVGGVKGVITSNTILVDGVDPALTNLPAYFMTTAESVKIGTTEQECGITSNEYISSVTTPLSFVVSTGASTTTYAVTVTFEAAKIYSATNYDFLGNVKTSFDPIFNGAVAGQTYNLDGTQNFYAFPAGIKTGSAYVTNSYATTITVTGALDSARPLGLGDQFKVAGETGTPWHRILSTVQTSGVTTSITFTPPLGAGAIANAAAVTISPYTGLTNGVPAQGNSTITIDTLFDSAHPVTVGDLFKVVGETGTPWHKVTATTKATIDTSLMSVNNAAGYAAAATTMLVDGFDDTANPIKAGSTFTVAGETGSIVHTISSTVLTGGITTSITFVPGLAIGGVTDNALITISGVSDNTVSLTFTPALGVGTTYADNAAVTFAFTASTPKTITGVVTAVSSTSLIYIQDQEAAISIYKNSAFANVKVGNKVTISGCLAGKSFNGLVEVSEYLAAGSGVNAFEIVNDGLFHDLYYIDANTTIPIGWVGVKDLKLRRYTGMVTTAASTTTPFAGVFDATGNNQVFKATSATNAAYFPITAVDKYYYGVIDVASNVSYMLLLKTDQVRAITP